MTDTLRGPAYRIETERLVIRCYAPADAALLKAAVDASIEHLRPWMPWISQEPEMLEAKVARLRKMRAAFDSDQDYVYGVFDRDEKALLGGTGLHTRIGANAREIGYWIHADHVGRGLATEVVAALTRVGFEVDGLARIEIHMAPGNVRSAALPRKLGYTHEATLRERAVDVNGAPRDTMIWSLFASDYPRTPSATRPITAFDATGAPIALR